MIKQKIFKFVRNGLSFLMAFLLIRYVAVRSDLDFHLLWTTVDRSYLVLAFLCFGVGFLSAAYRWYILLHYIEVNLPFVVVLRLALIGQFFNLFVPGGVGGDLIKMVYLRREAGERFAEAVLTVLLDRVLGLTGLLLLALLAIGLNPEFLTHSGPEMQAILFVVGVAGLSAMVGALAFLMWPYLGRLAGVAHGLMERLPHRIRGILERVAQALSLIRSSPSTVLLLLVIGMGNHLCATLAVLCVGKGVGGTEAVTFPSYLLINQLSNLVAAVPITPGGLGGRDLAMSFLLGMSGASESATGAVPLVVTALMIAWSCLGGLALLWERKAEGLGGEPGDKLPEKNSL